jgi:hypothetical protein
MSNLSFETVGSLIGQADSWTPSIVSSGNPHCVYGGNRYEYAESFEYDWFTYTTGLHIHLIEDSLNIVSDDEATSLTTLISLVNSIKAGYENHRVNINGPHGIHDLTNSVTSVDAIGLTSAITLVNEIRTDFNAHAALSTAVHLTSDTLNIVTTTSATGLTSAIALINEILTDYNNHLATTYLGSTSTFNTIEYESFEEEFSVEDVVGVTAAAQITHVSLPDLYAETASSAAGPFVLTDGDYFRIKVTSFMIFRFLLGCPCRNQKYAITRPSMMHFDVSNAT